MTSPASGLATVVEGRGPRVVMVHGSMDRASSFGRVTRNLNDCEVVRYDRRGYAGSAHLGPPTGFDQQVDDLLDVAGPAPVVVAGHSLGGTVALGAAARAPEQITALVVYECPLPWMPWWPRGSAGSRVVGGAADPGDAAEQFMRRVLGDERWQRLPPSARAARRAEGPTLVAEMTHLRAESPPFDLAAVRAPVVAASGSGGAPHHRASARTVAAEVADGEHLLLDGAGHGAHLSHPRAFADLVRRAVDRARPAGPQSPVRGRSGLQ